MSWLKFERLRTLSSQAPSALESEHQGHTYLKDALHHFIILIYCQQCQLHIEVSFFVVD